MTARQKLITTFYIIKHKLWIIFYMCLVIKTLIKRAILHDLSKFSKEEFEYVYILSTQGKNIKYGSKEYEELVKSVAPAERAHHYINRHHPNFYLYGINEMSPVDKIEMLVDFFAATKRKNGNIYDSLIINAKVFNISKNIKNGLYRDIKEILGD